MTTLTLIAAAVVAALPAARGLWAWGRRFRVAVWRGGYSERGWVVVGVRRAFGVDAIRIASIRLDDEDADEKLVAAKMEAATKARILNGIAL